MLCNIDDPAYVGCGHEQVRLNRNNANRNQEKIRDRLEHLNTKEFPPELEPIISYFHAVQSFALWRNQQEIDYAESRNVDDLERPYSPLGLDPKLSCAGVLQQIRTSSDSLSAWTLVVNEWQNCVWQAAIKSIGEYPQQTWSTALKSLGIREHVVLQEN